MAQKLILNIQFSQQVKFKMAYDTSGGKTFGDLKEACVKRLDAFAKVAPENLKQDLPVSFEPSQYSLQDQGNFILSDMDLVEDLCSNNDLIHLVFNQSVYVPKAPVQQPVPNVQTTSVYQPSIMASSNYTQSTLNVIQPPQKPTSPPKQPPVSSNQPPVPQNLANNGFMTEEQIQKLKQKFYLDTSAWAQSQSLGDYVIQLKFPQAQDPNLVYNFQCDANNSLYEVSQQICQRLGKQTDGCNAAFFSQKGLPLVANLNQLHQKTIQEAVKPLNQKIVSVILTRTAAGDKTQPKINSDEGKDQIFIIHQGPKVLKVDIDNDTVQQLKQKIYHKLNIPTNVLSLNYGGKILQDNLLLKDYNIQNNSNINLTFRMNQSVGYADSYNYNFYMPWMVHFVKQSESGIRQFRTHSLVYFKHENSLTFLHALRQLSQNNSALILVTASLMKRQRLNQNSRIALEEGFLRIFFDLIVCSQQIPANFQIDQIFEYTRFWFYQLIETSKLFKHHEIEQIETFKVIETSCQVTLQEIITPAYLKINQDDKQINWQIVNYETIRSRQQTEDKHSSGKPFSELELILDPQLQEQFSIVKGLDKEETIWLSNVDFQNQMPQVQISKDWHKNEDKLNLSCLKIHSSVELKQHPSAPALTKNSLKQFVIYTSMNKDVAKPVNLFDPINGIEQPENPDTIAYQQVVSKPGNTGTVDSDDESSIKLTTQITVEPEEAIIVLIDISGSMDEEFYRSDDLTRLGVVKAFFNAFADRTMAYNLKHVISLAYFDDRYLVKCDYTELFMQFKDLVNKAQPQGMTALYVALKNAIDSLLLFKKKYPNCILRIIALTDGEDNKGKYSPEFIAKSIVQNNIILDSFVVYDKCDGLKQITKAAGGQCFCPKTIQEGLRLFEFETILSAKIRKPQAQLTMQQVSEIFAQNSRNIEFDKEPRDIDLPIELKKQSVNPRQLVRRISMDSQQLNLIAPHIYLKRVMKELMTYEQKPHPFIKVFPCKHDVSFWKIILIGPEQTPYQGGTYVLYMRFPSEYPLKPPDLRFLTSIYHCNINKQGRICHSILGRNYTSDTRILQIFEAVYGLLMTPEPDDPLDTTIASEFMQDLQLYQQKAQQHTEKNAKRPMDEVLKEILGEDGMEVDLSDVELQEKIQEIESWINNAAKPQ